MMSRRTLLHRYARLSGSDLESINSRRVKVFYSIGFTGMIFSVDVITADTSSLRDRGLAYAFTSSPYIITAFAGPAASQDFYDLNWRWAYGSFAIVLPIVAVPMFALLRWNHNKAKRNGLLVKKEASGRSWLQSIQYYAVEFDSEFHSRRRMHFY